MTKITKKNIYLILVCILCIGSFQTGDCSLNNFLDTEGLRHRKPVLKLNSEPHNDVILENLEKKVFTEEKNNIHPILEKYFFLFKK